MGVGAGDGRGECFEVFFGDPKKLNLDFVGGGVTSLGGGTGCRTGLELAFIWATICGSRLTLKLSVNSSLLCSILVPSVSPEITPLNDGTYSSNSCSILMSAASSHSGVVT